LLAALSFLAVAILEATVLEVVFAAGLIGIYIDSFGEKQLRQWRNLRSIVARRRARIRTRMARRRRTLRKTEEGAEEPEESVRFRSLSLLGLAMPLATKLGLLLTLAAICLRMGSVTFGGGLVMVPLIESEVVNNHHWLTHQEFADATALGQITPGPVLIT